MWGKEQAADRASCTLGEHSFLGRPAAIHCRDIEKAHSIADASSEVVDHTLVLEERVRLFRRTPQPFLLSRRWRAVDCGDAPKPNSPAAPGAPASPRASQRVAMRP